ncbi:MAG: hypothetical protein AAFY71_05460 [Bacteroidota bacterium]
MQDEINDLQNLWQGQPTHTSAFEEVMGAIHKQDKKQKRDWIMILITFPITCITLLWVASLLNFSLFLTLGVCVILLAMLMIAGLMYYNLFQAVDADQDLSSKTFIQQQIHQLEHRKRITSRYMVWYQILLITGINISYLDSIAPMDPMIRVAIHLGTTLAIGIGAYFGIKKRMDRYKTELDPLIEQLQEWKTES